MSSILRKYKLKALDIEVWYVRCTVEGVHVQVVEGVARIRR